MIVVRWHRAVWPFKVPFRISYRVRTAAETLIVELDDGEFIGRGEAQGVSYNGETVGTLAEAIDAAFPRGQAEICRETIATELPPGGLRNAIDCALWDLEAKRAGRRAWELAGMSAVRPLETSYTLAVDTPDAMASAAVAASAHRILKLKLAGQGDVERVEAVRRARTDAKLIVDANQAWTAKQLVAWAPMLARLKVDLIEQPLPIDVPLPGFKSPVPLCADEACQTRASLDGLRGDYEYINIKLDKTGGLTEALALAREAQTMGFRLMVGCMGGSSLAMAPSFIVGQLCEYIDLDGPLWTTKDMDPPIHYDGGRMFAPEPGLWG